jgi:hypothetical protein
MESTTTAQETKFKRAPLLHTLITFFEKTHGDFHAVALGLEAFRNSGHNNWCISTGRDSITISWWQSWNYPEQGRPEISAQLMQSVITAEAVFEDFKADLISVTLHSGERTYTLSSCIDFTLQAERQAEADRQRAEMLTALEIQEQAA